MPGDLVTMGEGKVPAPFPPPNICFWEFQEPGLSGSKTWGLEPGLAVSMASGGEWSPRAPGPQASMDGGPPRDL